MTKTQQSTEESHRFNLFLNTDNAAFEDPAELPRILRKIADDVEAGGNLWAYRTIFDSNGNDVGRYALKPESYFAS